MRLFAISDLHVGFPQNAAALERMPSHPDDWLILGGDMGETHDHLALVLKLMVARFARVIWVPGNHELWTMPGRPGELRGEAKYLDLVALCRRHGVQTPEDPYVVWPGDGTPHLVAPLFLLYDYTFGPDDVPPDRAVDWARATEVECVDEHLLHPDPYPSRQAWCEARCRATEARLAEAVRTHDCPLVLINHFPLRRELAVLPRVPRFSIWCGTRRTSDWHLRFRASVVIYGHLHLRRTTLVDGVRFEEVSLGYPRQWQQARGAEAYLRQILPAAPPRPGAGAAGRSPA